MLQLALSARKIRGSHRRDSFRRILFNLSFTHRESLDQRPGTVYDPGAVHAIAKCGGF